MVCGNGIGTESHAVVQAVAPYCKKAVFDADALRLPLPVRTGETIYTPHAGEFARMTGKELPGRYDWAGLHARDAGISGDRPPQRAY